MTNPKKEINDLEPGDIVRISSTGMGSGRFSKVKRVTKTMVVVYGTNSTEIRFNKITKREVGSTSSWY